VTIADKIKGRISVDGGCWIWRGAKTWKGYGRVWWQGQVHYTHRAMFEAECGPIPADKQIDHLCRNTACCNPAHLEAVTPAENTRRGNSVEAAHRRKNSANACPHGHLFTPANTYVDRRGNRSCKACRRVRNDTWNETRKSQSYRAVTAQRRNVTSITRAKKRLISAEKNGGRGKD
jgi:hypothetical protein